MGVAHAAKSRRSEPRAASGGHSRNEPPPSRSGARHFLSAAQAPGLRGRARLATPDAERFAQLAPGVGAKGVRFQGAPSNAAERVALVQLFEVIGDARAFALEEALDRVGERRVR